jgi:hypothetical protein
MTTTTNNEKAVLFIGANRPIPGRETEAMRLWAETTSWLESQQNLGWFTRWDGCWLTPHGGDMNSAFMCWGDRNKLDEWRRTEAFEAWSWRAASCLEGFGVVSGWTWTTAKEQWERHLKTRP